MHKGVIFFFLKFVKVGFRLYLECVSQFYKSYDSHLRTRHGDRLRVPSLPDQCKKWSIAYLPAYQHISASTYGRCVRHKKVMNSNNGGACLWRLHGARTPITFSNNLKSFRNAPLRTRRLFISNCAFTCTKANTIHVVQMMWISCFGGNRSFGYLLTTNGKVYSLHAGERWPLLTYLYPLMWPYLQF